jgi:hypothetical protein
MKKLCVILLLALASAACQKEPYTKTFEGFEIVDGMIHSPQWLADEVEEVADLYDLTPSGEKCYPWVYKIEYHGQGYIFINDGLCATIVGGNLYFTLSGESVVGGSDLWEELFEVTGMLRDEDDLLWRYEWKSKRRGD